MIEEQVDEVFVAPERDAVLAADETEAVAQLQNEVAQSVDRSIFEFALLHLLPDAQELQVVAALQRFFGLLCQVLGQRRWEVVALAFGQGPLVGLCLDLVQQHIAAPAEAGRGLVQLAYAPQVDRREPSRAGEGSLQVAGKPLDYSVAPALRGLLLADHRANVPVQAHEFRVDGARRREACRRDARLEVGHESGVVESDGGARAHGDIELTPSRGLARTSLAAAHNHPCR